MMQQGKQTALITGATSGIGLAFAQVLAKKGCDLILVSRNEQKLNHARDDLKMRGGSVVVIPRDLSKPHAAQELYDHCMANNYDIDILVNNAGIGLYGTHDGLSAEKVDRMNNLNVNSLVALCSLFGKEMRLKRNGYILNVASTGAFQPLPKMAAYGASKSYVLNFSEALNREYESSGVSVTCLCPGQTESNFFIEAGVGNDTAGYFSRKNRMSAEKVAETGIKALFKKKMTVIPGMQNKALIFLNRILPRKGVAMIAKAIMTRP